MKKQHPLRRAAAVLLSLTLLLSLNSFTALANAGSYTISVREATGAPSSDIAPEINQAVKNYATVTIPKGEYKADLIRLMNLSNVTVDGSGSVITSTSSVASHASGILVRGCSNVTLKNFTLVGAGGHGIYVDDSSASISNVTVKDSQYCGVTATSAGTKLQIDNSQLLHNGLRPSSSVAAEDSVAAGLAAYKGAEVTATDCTFSENVASGVCITTEGSAARSTVTLYGAVIENNGDHGVGTNPGGVVNMAPSAARRCTVRGNKHHGVMLWTGSSSSFIKGVDMVSNGITGLDLGGSSTAALVENCTMTSNSSHGILVSNGSSIQKVSGCTVRGNGHHGVYVESPASVNLVNTKVESNKKEGLRLNGKKAKATVSGGSFSGNAGCGVAVDKQAQVTLSNKVTLKKNKRYGFYATKGTKSTLKSVGSSNNNADGIRFDGEKCTATVDKCTVSGNKGNGIVLQNKASLKKLTKTKVTKNKKHGLAIYAKCTVDKTNGSSFSKNKGKQVYVEKGAKTKLKTQ